MPKRHITTHVLDTARGHPARGVSVTLERYNEPTKNWMSVGKAVTNNDGRVTAFQTSQSEEPAEISTGMYRLAFDSGTSIVQPQKKNRGAS